jgi:putative intracellular protease/amidase
MKALIFIPPNDYKDETLKIIREFFDKWRVSYSISSFSNKECVGSHGGVCKLDINTSKAQISDYDGILLLDGKGIDQYKIYEFRPLLDIINEFHKRGKFIAAISNGIKIAARANVIKDKKISLPKDEETKKLVMLFRGIPSENNIMADGNIYTIKDSSKLDETLPELLGHLGIK